MRGIAAQCYQLLNEAVTGSQAGFFLLPRDFRALPSFCPSLVGKREEKKKILNQTKKKIEAGKEKHHNSSEFRENVSKG